MKILVIGRGGREQAIVWKLSQSEKKATLFCAPGNPGIGQYATCVAIDETDLLGLRTFALENSIDLTFVGPEVPLTLGIVDVFESAGLKIVGPNKKCAQLEGSKEFTKAFLEKYHIPTGAYTTCVTLEEGKAAIGKYGYPCVIKADGLAAGKGVVIVDSKAEGEKVIDQMMGDKVFGASGEKVVIEAFLQGTETSILCFVDHHSIIPMVPAQDYKPAFDGNKGPNTGGMGTYSPSHIYDCDLEQTIEKDILAPILKGFQEEGLDFKGILFIGLMIENGVPKVLEFNTRFGDPETQSVLPRLETDLIDIFESITTNTLKDQLFKWRKDRTVSVVMASQGYPGPYEVGKEIHGLDTVDSDILVFHSGTKVEKGKLYTQGGRVLTVTALGHTFEAAREKVYDTIKRIQFEGAFYRKDIGL